jgi:hypothetical protein
MARKHEPLEVVDSSGLTDDDWAKINRLRHLHESGDSKALSKAFAELADDWVDLVVVVVAWWRNVVSRGCR